MRGCDGPSATPCMQVRVGPKTAKNDLQMKLRQARGFIDKGYRVKAAVPHRHWQRAEAAEMLARVRELAGQFAAVKEPAANERLARNTLAVYLTPL